MDPDQIPQADGESNFVSDGWQISGTDTLDVLIDGDYWIFAGEDSDIRESNVIPERVLQFMAVVEEMNGGQITVRAAEDGPEFSNIRNGSRFLLPLSAYDPGIYADMPVLGNPVLVACGGHIEERAEPVKIPWVYQISPVGSQPYQSADKAE